MAAPDTECVRLRPITTRPSSSPAETRISAGTAGTVIVVVDVVWGITKYRPIAERTAAFAALPIPPSSTVVVVGDERFLYCQRNKTKHGKPKEKEKKKKNLPPREWWGVGMKAEEEDPPFRARVYRASARAPRRI